MPWAVSMLRTRHKTFGNLSGYSAAGVDMNNLASWIGSQVRFQTLMACLLSQKNKPTAPPFPPSFTAQFDDTLTWADIEWVKSVWGGRMVVKGIMSAQDAVRSPFAAAADQMSPPRRCLRCCCYRGSRLSLCHTHCVRPSHSIASRYWPCVQAPTPSS